MTEAWLCVEAVVVESPLSELVLDARELFERALRV
jgi:hypothetical protein